MKASDVFTPQRVPTVTLVTRHIADVRALFDDVVEEGGKLIRIVGPSKSGKTVFIQNAVGAGNLVSVTGAAINNASDLWTRVLGAVGSDVAISIAEGQETSGGYSAGGTIAGNAIIASGEAQAGIERSQASSSTRTVTRAVDLLQAVISEFAGSGLTIFVDDFHYIPTAIQVDVARQIKQAAERGVRLVCAAVPFRSEDVLRANDDLQGRIADFRFEYWSIDDLLLIAHQGFQQLGIVFNETYCRSIASEAAGSPQLMQSLCLTTCQELGVRETASSAVSIPDDRTFFEQVCSRVANGVDFTSTIDKMKAGPMIRGRQRVAYALRDGTTADVYPIIVRALKADPPTLHFRYADLNARVNAQCVSDSPHVSDACYHIAKIANAPYSSDKMDWDPEGPILSIRDPYLLFAIRWT